MNGDENLYAKERADFSGLDWRNSAGLVGINILALLAMVAGFVVGHFLPQSPCLEKFNAGAISVFWDGRWYRDIASHGYNWVSIQGSPIAHFQNLAFFPLYALIERAVSPLPFMRHEWGQSLLSLVFGIWSNFAFSRFAFKILDKRAAFWASVLFICWPAACFLWMGYPTGVINLCAIYCLQNYIDGNRYKAAFWCGLGTAAAPTIVFIAAALCFHIFIKIIVKKFEFREFLNLIIFGLLSVWGLLFFMAYLFVKFHNAFIFVQAQSAWGTSENFMPHLRSFFDLQRYFEVVGLIKVTIDGVLNHHLLSSVAGRDGAAIILQFALCVLCIVLNLVFVRRHSNRLENILSVVSVFVVLGYFWFEVSEENYFLAGIRLCFPAIGLFINVGKLAEKNRFFSAVTLGLALVLLFVESALVKSGYYVV